jgi:hypothetical protein
LFHIGQFRKQKDFIIVPAIYEQYHKARNELYSNILNIDHMSTYNPLNIQYEKAYPMGPMTGYFDNDDCCNIKQYIFCENWIG